jgi:serine/threonine-protein kinase RsbW
MRRSFPKVLGALPELFNFLDGFVDAHRLDEPTRYALRLAVEELFTNMVKYRSGKGKDVVVDLEVVVDELRVELVERDVEKFDPTETRSAPPAGPLATRRPGGLGLHLVRRYFDRLDYDYRERISTIRLVKRLDPEHV